jgi:hypothetical protein
MMRTNAKEYFRNTVNFSICVHSGSNMELIYCDDCREGKEKHCEKRITDRELVAHAYNPSYVGG